MGVRLGSYLAHLVATNSDTVVDELLRRGETHDAVDRQVTMLGSLVDTYVRSAHSSAAKLGALEARRQARALGVETPLTPVPAPVRDDFLDEVLSRVDGALRVFRTELREAVQDAYHGVAPSVLAGPPTPQQRSELAAARTVVVRQAALQASRRLGVRLGLSATTAARRSYVDAEQRVFGALPGALPGLVPRKRWLATGPNPCPACLALHGTEIGLGEEFDAQAGASESFRPPAVFFDLQGPPRHPSCRCSLNVVFTRAGEQYVREVTREPPAPPRRRRRMMTADQVRRMPETAFRAFVTFLTGIVRRLGRRG